MPIAIPIRSLSPSSVNVASDKLIYCGDLKAARSRSRSVWAWVNTRNLPARRICFHCDVAWMKRYKIRGVVIGSHIFFADPPDSIPAWTFRHELEHAYQIICNGAFKFYFNYFIYQIRYGYKNNPFEIGARAVESMPLTINEEEILCRLKDDWLQLQNASGLKLTK